VDAVSITTENYLKRIYSVAESSDERYVGLGALAEKMGVTPGTITTMMKSLERSGLVEYKPRTGVRLTALGERQALDVLRKHRLIELFLVQTLGFDWSEVHEEAEELEHAVSDRLLHRIDEILGYPTVDPHGDPIPNSEGAFHEVDTSPLSDQRPGSTLEVARVENTQSRFLDYAKDVGLVPGTELTVLNRREESDTIQISVGSTTATLSLRAAQKIHVKRRQASSSFGATDS
jgi:DtxR family Mn-dependent transcriptional regulator